MEDSLFSEFYGKIPDIIREHDPFKNEVDPNDHRLITAYHESGHAIFAIIYELGLLSVEIDPNNPKDGKIILEPYNSESKNEGYIKHYYAGIASQYYYTGEMNKGDNKGDYWRMIENKNFGQLYYFEKLGTFEAVFEEYEKILRATIPKTRTNDFQRNIHELAIELNNSPNLRLTRKDILSILIKPYS
ncbi:hypothetical protein LCGC14_2783560 [marine sediment metagenome]|uniref:Peptidase M41 domain-containing protein n=1 Tax=marine sediment metagenome TaxID=412755 RepID=A0A0F9BJ51_9ZZZZ|nr:hypothetical protein [Bacteroides sp.]